MAYSLKMPLVHNHVSNPNYWDTFTTADSLISRDFASASDAEIWAIENGATACIPVEVAPQPCWD